MNSLIQHGTPGRRQPAGATTNYSEFEADGTLTMAGAATVWEDLRIEPAARDSNRAPAFEKWFDDAANSSRGVYLFSFTDESENEKEIHFTMQMPHAWAGTPISMHVHWVPKLSDTTATPRWGLEYTWLSIDGIYADTTPIYAIGNSASAADLVAGKHMLTEFAHIDPAATANGLSSILIGRLWRNSSHVADTYNVADNKCGLLYIDAHYEINTLGSRLELAK